MGRETPYLIVEANDILGIFRQTLDFIESRYQIVF